MICQIYDVSSTEEALALMDAGADFLGFAPGEVSEGRISPEETLKILKAIEGKAVRVVITLSDDEESILRDAAFYRPDVLHVVNLRTSKFRATKSFADKLRAQVPGMKFMYMQPMDEQTTVEEALRLAEFSDYIILDTGMGATGKTHDWNVSKKIVEQCGVPVILAGGLGPDNVAEAVRFVKPWGVDSMTRTNKILPDGSVVKDIDKVRRFCEEAKKAEAEYLRSSGK